MWLLWTVVAVVGAGVLTGLLVSAASRGDALRDQTMSESGTTEVFEPLGPEPLSDEAIGQVRFDQVARGYRMTQVDGVIDRLRDELLARDAEIARLRSALTGAPTPQASTATAPTTERTE